MTLPVRFWHPRVCWHICTMAFAMVCATWPLAAMGQAAPVFAAPVFNSSYISHSPPAIQYQSVVAPQFTQLPPDFAPPSAPPAGLFPLVTTPYRGIAPPFVDFSTEISNDDIGTDASYQARFTGDFLFMSGELFLEGSDGGGSTLFGGDNDDDGDGTDDNSGLLASLFGSSDTDLISDARFTLSRKDPKRRLFSDHHLIGQFGISEITLGDIFTPNIPMLTSQVEGRGFLVSSFPLDSSLDFDTRTLRGALPPGWTVELFRNGAILGMRETRGDGRYEFLDVPLLLEDNNFRLEFFGPQGQRRTEEVTVPGLPSALLSGKNFFRVAYNQENARFFPFADTRQDGPARLFAEYERMINPNFTFKGHVTSIELSDDVRHLTYGMGLRGMLGDTTLELIHVDDLQSGRGMLGTFRTDIFGLDISLEHGRFFDLETETLGVLDDFFIPILERQTNIRIDGSLPAFGMIPEFTYSASHNFDRAKDDSVGKDSNLNISTSLGETFLSHDLSVFQFNDPFFGRSPASVFGSLFLTSQIPVGPGIVQDFLSDIRVTSFLNYDLQPTRQFTFFSLTGATQLPNDWSAELQFDRSVNPAGATTWTPSVSRSFGIFSFSANAEIIDQNDNLDITLGMALNFGAAREPRTGMIVSEPGNIASGGAVSIRVYIDDNQNGRFDIGEATLPGIGFDPSLTFQLAGAATDTQGIAFVTNLPTFQEVVIALDPNTYAGAPIRPILQGVRIVPRPGVVTLVDLPFVPIGPPNPTGPRFFDQPNNAANFRDTRPLPVGGFYFR